LAETVCIALTVEHFEPCEATQTQLIPASIQQQLGTELGNISGTEYQGKNSEMVFL